VFEQNALPIAALLDVGTQIVFPEFAGSVGLRGGVLGQPGSCLGPKRRFVRCVTNVHVSPYLPTSGRF
jgi:hypothetical protein